MEINMCINMECKLRSHCLRAHFYDSGKQERKPETCIKYQTNAKGDKCENYFLHIEDN